MTALWSEWKAASNGAKKHHFFVTRQGLNGQGAQMAEGRNGNARWFGSYKAAKAVADELNANADLFQCCGATKIK